MKKTLFLLTLIGSIAFVACEKNSVKDTFEEEISSELTHITLPASDFDIRVSEILFKGGGEDFYTSGILEYKLNGEILAVVDFDAGTTDDKAKKYQNGIEEEIDLRQEGGKSEYVKVVVEPLVKADDCNYIVAGIIKYYDLDKKWLATIDFGDGACDNIAIKETDEGFISFDLDKWDIF